LLQIIGKNNFHKNNFHKNSTASRKTYVEKFKKLQIEASISEIISSAYLASDYISKNHEKIKNVYLIGERGIKEELEEIGIKVFGGEEDSKKEMTSNMFLEFKEEEIMKIDSVVIGKIKKIKKRLG
jgi:ribonucleotide monophosphatase NagD (HAD superfamily)